jgi:hypothetical protein
MSFRARVGLGKPRQVPVYTTPATPATPGKSVPSSRPKALAYVEVFERDPVTGRILIRFSDGETVEVETSKSRSDIGGMELKANGDLVVVFRDALPQNLGPLKGLSEAAARAVAEAASDLRWITYRHVQEVPSTVWTITHGLGCRPSVTVVDSAGEVVEGEVVYLSDDAVRLTFSAAFGGEAYLN